MISRRTINADIGWVSIREVRPDDWEQLRRFHSRLSMETIQSRFHAAKKELSEPLARRLTDLDGEAENAVVAVDTKTHEIVGVGRYARIAGQVAEVAFVVADDFQS